MFLLDASAVSGYMLYCATRFRAQQSERNARTLFRATLIHLPLVLGLMLLHKKGQEGGETEHTTWGKETPA